MHLKGKVLLLFTCLVILLISSCGKRKTQIILISIDTLRGDHLGAYGFPRATSPHLDQLIKESHYYKNAYTNGCWTIPAHMSLLTGTLPSRHNVNKSWNAIKVNKKYPKLNRSIKLISEILKEKNKKLGTLKFALLSNGLGFSRGFDSDNRSDPFENQNTYKRLTKLIQKVHKKDFFFFIHTWWVHSPYTHSHFLQKQDMTKEQRDNIDNFKRMSKKQRGKLIGREANKIDADFKYYLKKQNLFNPEDCLDLYDGGIRYVDQYIGRIIQKTKELGIYKNLLFVVVSDHGEHFAEHYPNIFYGHHGHDYFEEFIKVPIIIKYPHNQKNRTILTPVSLIDIVPTVLDYYNLDIPSYVQGNSLLKPNPKGSESSIVSEAISDSRKERKMIRIGDLKFIIDMAEPNKKGRLNWDKIINRRLYDIRNDPLEKQDLFRKKLKYQNIASKFEDLLKKIISDSVRLNTSDEEAVLDEKTIQHLKALGYL